MSSKAEKEKQKLIQDKCLTILNELLRDEDNKYCVDCDAKGPRWASWNLGIFLCIRCAGIHRNLGVHISKVKSVNLDSWTPDQVVSLQQMGNSRARAVYEANLPDSFRRPQHDSSLEAFIRAKYEQKKYIAKEWVPTVIPKVNWDKEIEESRKKKDGKRRIGGNISLPTPELHALPKPKSPNSTPKPIRAAAMISALESAAEKKSSSSAAVDLLGLDVPSSTIAQAEAGDDIFTSFLSAPAADTSQADTGKRSEEEDSFFNQPAPQDKKPLTKDSIMALYSQGGTQQQQQPQQPVFGIQGGIFASQGFQGVQPAANMGFPPVSNLHNMPQNGMFAGAVPNMGMTSNPFFAAGMPTSAPGLPGAAPSGFQGMPLQEPAQDLMADFASFATQQMPAPSQQLPQQMSRMNLGGAQPTGIFGSSSNNGHTLSTNLWQ